VWCGWDYDFAGSRSGEYARALPDGWHGKLVCDDYGGYKASFLQGINEIGCAAHARRKFFEPKLRPAGCAWDGQMHS
jgi:hypothetical protein